MTTTKMTKDRAEAIMSDLSWGCEVRELARLAAEHLGGKCTSEWIHDQLNGCGAPVGGTIGDRINALASQRDTARNTLPQDVRDALQCAADYAPMPILDFHRKWKFDNGREGYQGMSSRCAAALAAHPDAAPMVPPFEGDPKECAFKSQVDARIEAVRGETEIVMRNLRTANENMVKEAAMWQARAEWLLERMSKEAQ